MAPQGVTIIDEPEAFDDFSALTQDELDKQDYLVAPEAEETEIDSGDSDLEDESHGVEAEEAARQLEDELPAMSRIQKVIISVCVIAAVITLVYLFLMWFIL